MHMLHYHKNHLLLKEELERLGKEINKIKASMQILRLKTKISKKTI